jgi:hypothetical protein
LSSFDEQRSLPVVEKVTMLVVPVDDDDELIDRLLKAGRNQINKKTNEITVYEATA